jgi:hypothetical protein
MYSVVSQYPDIFISDISTENILNKLFCTFTSPSAVDETISTISSKYSILFNKIFVLESPDSDELVCTYNIDTGNVSSQPLPNTILLHRKKESNTLYTINALNTLIKSLNGGVLDTQYRINWYDYKNCILLTTGEDLRRLDTKINKVVNL